MESNHSLNRLKLVEAHLHNAQTGFEKQPMVSGASMTDGDKKYAEVVDYHPEKGVSRDESFVMSILLLCIYGFQQCLPMIYRLSLIT